jgi:hypothetical protein
MSLKRSHQLVFGFRFRRVARIGGPQLVRSPKIVSAKLAAARTTILVAIQAQPTIADFERAKSPARFANVIFVGVNFVFHGGIYRQMAE